MDKNYDRKLFFSVKLNKLYGKKKFAVMDLIHKRDLALKNNYFLKPSNPTVIYNEKSSVRYRY